MRQNVQMSEITEILCLSNGHGEDQIAVKICAELKKLKPRLIITALPLVGIGHAYSAAQIEIASAVTQKLPSGGFSRMDSKELWKDMRGGLLGLTWRQFQLIWKWSRLKPNRLILAVGDIVPLVLAWLPTWQGGCNYAFVATAKSEYYWRDFHGQLTNAAVPFGGSIFYPWERYLIGNRHCLATFGRDQLTAEFLMTKFNLPVLDLGNPMMDGLEPKGIDFGINPQDWVIAMLPGSRVPEAYENWNTLLMAAQEIMRKLTEPANFLAAIAPDLEIEILVKLLVQNGWIQNNDQTFSRNQSKLNLVTDGFGDCLHLAHFGLGMAGTATEQLVGLGKPVITIVGKGPQFTRSFAQDQARLLGQSIILAENLNQIGTAITLLLEHPDYFQIAISNGQERMGKPGAARRIAQHILDH